MFINVYLGWLLPLRLSVESILKYFTVILMLIANAYALAKIILYKLKFQNLNKTPLFIKSPDNSVAGL